VTEFADLGAGLNASLTEVNDVIGAIDEVRMAAIVDNIATASEQVASVSTQLGGVVGRANGLIEDAGALVGAVDPEQVRSTLANIDSITGRVNTATERLDAIVADAGRAVTQFGDLGAGLNATLVDVNGVIAAVDRERIAALVDGLASASEQIGGVVERADTLIAAVDPERIRSSVATVDEVIQRIGAASLDIETIVADARQISGDVRLFADGLDATLTNVNSVIEAVDAQRIANTVANIETVSGRLGAIVDQAGGFIDQASALVAAVDPELVRSTLANIDTVTARASAASAQFETVVANANAAIDSLATFGDTLNETLADVNGLVAAVDRERIQSIVADANEITGRLRAASDDVASIMGEARVAVTEIGTFAAGLSAREEDIGVFIENARDISQTLTTASGRLDNILTNAETFFSDQEGGFLAEVNAAAVSLRNMAESFESRADEISTGLVRFSGRGLENLTGLIEEARVTLSQFERLATSLEREPNQIIFGGAAGVRDYNRQ
jgi:phospholipid/cholesterol/gamma-HCH transport system substrate-binding protein